MEMSNHNWRKLIPKISRRIKEKEKELKSEERKFREEVEKWKRHGSQKVINRRLTRLASNINELHRKIERLWSDRREAWEKMEKRKPK